MLLKQLIVLAAASTVLSSCSRHSAPVDARSEEARIREQSSAWTAAIVAGDVDKIINLYAADAVQLQGGMHVIAGRDSIRAWYETWVHDPALSYTATTAAVEVASSLDLAYERGAYSF